MIKMDDPPKGEDPREALDDFSANLDWDSQETDSQKERGKTNSFDVRVDREAAKRQFLRTKAVVLRTKAADLRIESARVREMPDTSSGEDAAALLERAMTLQDEVRALLKEVQEEENVTIPYNVGSLYEEATSLYEEATSLYSPKVHSLPVQRDPPPGLRKGKSVRKAKRVLYREDRRSQSMSGSGHTGPDVQEVQFLIASKSTLALGAYTPVDVYAFTKILEKEVLGVIAEEFDNEAKTKRSGSFPLHTDTRLTITLESPHAEIDEASHTFTWTGMLCKASFHVLVPEQCERTQILLKSRIYANSVLICTLSTVLDVARPNPSPELKIIRIEEAFVSYSSQDRASVLLVLEGIQHIAPKLSFFLDVISLRSGEWEPQLYKAIDRSDIFYLFWSRHAKASPYVEKEWRYALSQRGLDFIEPIPLEDPSRVPPPEELKQKHFNSWTLHCMTEKPSEPRKEASVPSEAH